MTGRALPRPRRALSAALGLLLVIGVGVAAVRPAAWGAAGSAPSSLPTVTLPPSLPTVTVTPKAAATKSAKATKPVAAKKLTLKQLRAVVAADDKDLAARTAALQKSIDALTVAKQQFAAVSTAARTARLAAEQAHLELGRYASAAYRGQQLSAAATVFLSPSGGATDALRTLGTLEQTGDIKTDIATYAQQTALRAQALERQAAALATQALAATEGVQAQRNDVAARATANQKALRAEVRRIAKEKAKLAAKGCLDKVALAESFPNGMIPLEVLCPIGIGAHHLRGDAAVAFRLLAAAYQEHFDKPICVTSSYRTRELQAQLFANDPVMVALPGRSHHGLGLATDLCGGIENFGSAPHKWMNENAAKYGFFLPDWAQPGGVTPEPWHWEFKVASYPSNDGSADNAPAADAAPTAAAKAP